MYVILPFEKEFFEKKHNYPVNFLGHPLIDSISNFQNRFQKDKQEIKLNNKPVVAILPGSRKQEIKKILKTVIKVINDYPDHQFIIAGAPNIENSFYKKFLNDLDITIVQNKTYELLSISSAAIVTSGTATLETALFKVPQIVCYKSSFISYIIAKLLVKIKYISLVNLIMDKEIVKELIQQNCNKDSISLELNKILNPDHRKKLLLNYSKLISVLGKPGTSRRIANDIIKT
jgi:lipid-A-disaccharide synthase